MTKKTVIRVISAAVSKTGAVFYTEDGEEKTISITNPQISEMVNKVLEAVNSGNVPVEVDISTYTVFNQIEKESGGFLKFFRVATKKLTSILGGRASRGKVSSHGMVTKPSSAEVAIQPGTEPVTPKIVEQLSKAHTEAESKILPVEETTVVAVVGDTPIVGAEALEGHAKASVAMGETIGFQRTMERLGKVAKERKHTVQEALAFLKKMDLPFANDGCILAYKSLTRTREEEVFLDNYSMTLKQGLGTLVQMDVELVDDNRRVLCSNGLHVARRGYLSGYGTSGSNVVCLIKIAPEDIISVPMNEQDKMRVRAYHIVAVLSHDDLENIKKQKSFTQGNMDKASLLAKVIRGDHVPVLNITTQHKTHIDQMIPVQQINKPVVTGKPIEEAHTVEVQQEQPVDLDLKKINEQVKKPVTPNQKKKVVEQQAPTKKPTKKKASKVNPKDVQKLLNKGKKEAVAPKTPVVRGGPNKVRQAFEAWKRNPNDTSRDVLLLAKKQSKKSWKALGFTPTEIAQIEG